MLSEKNFLKISPITVGKFKNCDTKGEYENSNCHNNVEAELTECYKDTLRIHKTTRMKLISGIIFAAIIVSLSAVLAIEDRTSS